MTQIRVILTGGVAIYVDKTVNFKVVYNKHISKTWILGIKISDSLLNGFYAVVYKSPKEKINDFLNVMDNFLEDNINDENDNLILCRGLQY